MLEWIQTNWELITAIAATIVAILKYLKQAKYAKIIEAVVGQIEAMGKTPASLVLKKRIKTVNQGQGTEAALKKIVKKVTEPLLEEGD